MKFYIRPATSHDLPFIQEMTRAGINIWGNEIYDNLKPWIDTTCSIEMMSKNLLSPNRDTFIAEKDGCPVGTVYIDVIDSTSIYFGGLYCSIRKSGLGTTLMEHIIDYASSKGYTSMSCEIYEKNLASISLMKKFGAYYTCGETVAGATYNTYCFDLDKTSILV